MDLGIKGRIALISGADSGMGKETARLLLEAGVRVALTDKPDGTLDEAVQELSALGECIGVTGDVNEVDDLCAMAGIRAVGFKCDSDFSDEECRRLNIKKDAEIHDPR